MIYKESINLFQGVSSIGQVVILPGRKLTPKEVRDIERYLKGGCHVAKNPKRKEKGNEI